MFLFPVAKSLISYIQHAAAVVGNKMVVVGGESGNKLLDDVQVHSNLLSQFFHF